MPNPQTDLLPPRTSLLPWDQLLQAWATGLIRPDQSPSQPKHLATSQSAESIPFSLLQAVSLVRAVTTTYQVTTVGP